MEVAEQLGTLSVACEGGRGMGEGDAPLPPGALSVAGRGLSAAGAAVGEGLPLAGPEGDAVGGRAPSPAELPAPDRRPGNGSSSPGICTWPESSPAAASVAGGEERIQGPRPPAQGGGPPGPEEAAEGGSSSVESDSDSDTDTDSSSSVSTTSSCPPVLSEDDNQQCKKDENSQSTGEKDELSEDKSLPVEDLTILLPESVELMPFGNVSSIIENLVIVESLKGLPPVNEDSVLFKQDRYSIGKVFEVFGPVSHPFYALQFKNSKDIETKGIKIHDAVYFAPSVESFTQYIFPEKIKQDKGSDASWKNDEEPPPEALDFSDDEKEKVAKQQKKSQNLRRKKFKSQDESNENGIHYQPRIHYPSNYSSGSLKGEQNPYFSRGRFPYSPVHPHSYRQYIQPPQHYCSDNAAFRKPSTSYQRQRMGRPGRQQRSFPPPSFGTVSNAANPFPLSPPPWRWPHGCMQNTYDPLLSLLSLPPPPPPPPPLPPPSTASPDNTNLL